MFIPTNRPEPRLRRRPDAASGYSLLEVLVTLALLALAASVVMPGLSSGLGSAARHSARLALEGRVLELRRMAMNENEPYRLGPKPQSEREGEAREGQLELPPGWSFAVDPSIVYFPDGTCSGGVVTLNTESGREGGKYIVRPPQCRPARS